MGIRCVGHRNGKYIIEETEPNIRLKFMGKDANRFEQKNPPRGKRVREVEFKFTIKDFHDMFPGFLPEIKEGNT